MIRRSLVPGLCLLVAPAHADEPVDFARDIRPILGTNCLRCHGFDEAARQRDLRLDEPNAAIVPGDRSAVACRLSNISAIVFMTIFLKTADSRKRPLGWPAFPRQVSSAHHAMGMLAARQSAV